LALLKLEDRQPDILPDGGLVVVVEGNVEGGQVLGQTSCTQ